MKLQTCRPITMGGPGQIPWTAVHQYAQGKAVADVERFEFLVHELDVTYLSAYYQRIEAARA